MRTEDLGNSRLLYLIFRPAGRVMESRLRHRLTDPVKTLQGAGIEPGQAVLEVGSGTGFFTMPAARLLGESGHLIAIEPLATYVERLTSKVQAAGLRNAHIIKGDALGWRRTIPVRPTWGAL